ncbi:MAG: alkaline phosphatase [Alphaproteobacteria bacterium]|jgi:tartrate-resistant acid phosphatase type 5|nr:alkaline phosphatase [Alphaproteobacteria bacterium]MBT5390319.1 alkaline phosphatase [Alphaproteobacteria bacterium]
MLNDNRFSRKEDGALMLVSVLPLISLSNSFALGLSAEEIFSSGVRMMRKIINIAFVVTIGVFQFGFDASSAPIKFAAFGDYGENSNASVRVASLVKSQNPDFIVTTGDNNYPCGARETIDDNVGSHYSTYIYPYSGKYEKPVGEENRFFPCIGNHDLDSEDGEPYLDYFQFLKRARYYDFVKGSVHFFMLSSDQREPDGIEPDSKQLLWLKEGLHQSSSPWKIVVFHHPPYSSEIMVPPVEKQNFYTKNRERRIFVPLAEWGASAVLSGHIHVYERFDVGGIPYIISGLGGGQYRYEFIDKSPESEFRFSEEHGALFVEADEKSLQFKFMTVSKKVVDNLEVRK